MSSPPRVSVITPTRNHGRFIAAAIESVLAQDFSAWELTVIDDASGDGTAEIAGGYAARDGRIRVIRHGTSWGMEGLAGTYNQGLAAGRGEWVAILEGDDEWPPGKIGRQLAELDGEAAVVLGYGRALLLSASGRRLALVQDGLPASFQPYFAGFRGSALEPLLLRPCFIHPVTVMIRRPALEAIGGFQRFPGLDLADHPTFLELARRGPFFGSAEILGHYRRHHDSQSLNRIVELTRGERRLAFAFLGRAAAPDSPPLRRRMERSWALEEGRALLTEGRLRLLRRQPRAARLSFLRCLAAERAARWRHPSLLGVKALALAALLLSFFPGLLERAAGLIKRRATTLLDESEDGIQ